MPLIFAFFGAYAFHPLPILVFFSVIIVGLLVTVVLNDRREKKLDEYLDFHQQRLENIRSDRARRRGVPVEWVKDTDLEKCLASIERARVNRNSVTFYETDWDPKNRVDC